MAYFSLATWGFMEWLTHRYDGVILNPLGFLAYFGIFIACLILAAVLFLQRPRRGWLSETRIVACLLLLPLLWNLA